MAAISPVDATDDPLHTAQEEAFFHGFYRQSCYLPLYCFCGNIPLFAKLRDCKRDASDGTVEALAKIVPAIRKRFGRKVHIIVRGDASFAREPIMSWCEAEGVFYCFGLARNDRLQAQLENEFERLQEQIDQGVLQAPCRSFVEFEYATLQSWSSPYGLGCYQAPSCFAPFVESIGRNQAAPLFASARERGPPDRPSRLGR